MGEGTAQIAGSGDASGGVAALNADASAARDRLEALVVELRRRRDKVMDWRTQLRQHRRELTVIGGALVVLAGAGLGAQIARRRRQTGLAARVAELADKAERLQRALGRIVEDPDRLAPVAAPRKKRAVVWATISAALPLVRILLPHIVTALARPSKRP